jgi:hypothetical protein
MFTLLCLDLALNSSLDYDNYDSNIQSAKNWLEWNGGVPSALLALQAIIQISIFLALFLAMADTFLFRVGLLGVIMKKFRAVLLLHPIYLGFTLAIGIYRVNKLDANTGTLIVDMWSDRTYIGLSIMQKLVAVPYYLFNMRATVKLSERKYFDKDAWISLIKRNQVQS